jgi:hypothetical protein
MKIHSRAIQLTQRKAPDTDARKEAQGALEASLDELEKGVSRGTVPPRLALSKAALAGAQANEIAIETDSNDVEATFEPPEGSANANAATMVVGGDLWLVITWAELTPGERAEAQIAQARARGGQLV